MKPWIRVDADVFGHPKFVGISPAVFVAWVRGLAHCRQFRTDGTIAPRVVPTIATKKLRADLVGRKLWHEREDGGIDVHEFGDYQLTEAEWKARSEAGKKGAQARWGDGKSHAKRMTNRMRTASDSYATPIATDPDTDTEKKTLSGVPLGRYVRYELGEVLAWIESCKQPGRRAEWQRIRPRQYPKAVPNAR